MKDVVIVPTYTRPEYLHLCLTHLAQTERTNSAKKIWVCQDKRQNDEHRYGMVFNWVDEVIAQFKGPLDIQKFTARPHNYPGNSYNTLEAYRLAVSSDARFVYLVEDDVLVKPDFFKFHEHLQYEEPEAMCTIAYRCSRNSEVPKDNTDPNAYFTTARDYASIGVCWKKENLLPVIEHCDPAYYSNMDQYMIQRFPGNRFAGDFAEQDGLITRVMWEQKTFTAWAVVPRCYHVGYYGYHRPGGKRPEGYWEQKAATLRDIIADPERLIAASPDFGDIEPVPPGPVAPWNRLVKIQHYD